jgi:OmpR-family two-component system manganese-sensing sensor histidine kinase
MAGSPPEDLPHGFNSFYREQRPTSASPAVGEQAELPPDRGLGLSVSSGLVEAQGGYMQVESHLDEGTIVTLKFPLVESASPVKETYGTTGT